MEGMAAGALLETAVERGVDRRFVGRWQVTGAYAYERFTVAQMPNQRFLDA